MRGTKLYTKNIWAALLFLVAPFAHYASAATVCVNSGNASLLSDSLTSPPNPLTIKLEKGVYYFNSDLDVFTHDVKIMGGYAPGTNCDDFLRIVNANNTILDMTQHRLSINDELNNALTLDGLSISHAAITAYSMFLYFEKVTLSNVLFSSGGRLKIKSSSNSITMTNVAIERINTTDGDGCAVRLEMGGSLVTLVNTTIGLSSGNLCFDQGTFPGGLSNVELWNSIVWDFTNSGYGIKTLHSWSSDPIGIDLQASIYPLTVSLAPGDELLIPTYPSVQQDPQWTNPAAGDYTLSGGANSPAINKGTWFVPNPPGVPQRDIVGNPRVVGPALDLGAYESSFDGNQSVFHVTNAQDNLTTGSLRWAITQANASNSPSLIDFYTSCPAIIKLNSPLPGITGQLTIDGYSAATSSPNTDPDKFNAKFCVALEPASGVTVDTALTVPVGSNGSLNVSGLLMGGFSHGISLLGGSGHVVHGNQFGWGLFGFDRDAVRIDTSGPVLIGGSDPGARNVFLNVYAQDYSASAVLAGAYVNNTNLECQIVNNWMGLAPPSGSSVGLNSYRGIYLLSNGCSVTGNRMANLSWDAIAVVGSNNFIQSNRIGGPTGLPGQWYPDLGAGIRISGDNNIVGVGYQWQYDPRAYGNWIQAMDGGGVVVSSGIGNSIRGNWITYNGPSRNGMNVDLFGDGPTPNDLGDADMGPNQRQNFPVLRGLAWNSGIPPLPGSTHIPGNVNGVLHSAAGMYQLDVYYVDYSYYNDWCSTTTHRGGGIWLGGSLTPVDGSAPFSIALEVPHYDPATAGYVSVTATDSAGNTSELSSCMSIDTIFRDGVEY